MQAQQHQPVVAKTQKGRELFKLGDHYYRVYKTLDDGVEYMKCDSCLQATAKRVPGGGDPVPINEQHGPMCGADAEKYARRELAADAAARFAASGTVRAPAALGEAKTAFHTAHGFPAPDAGGAQAIVRRMYRARSRISPIWSPGWNVVVRDAFWIAMNPVSTWPKRRGNLLTTASFKSSTSADLRMVILDG
jgi:hypothetical protein